MGSRLMHYCIAALIESRLGWHSPEFMLGNLAPDVAEYGVRDQNKRLSHFVRLDSVGEGFFDLERFVARYLREQRSLFHIGYYFHLLADDLWIKRIYIPTIQHASHLLRTDVKECYQRDLNSLGGRLMRHYQLLYTDLEHKVLPMAEADLTCLPQLVDDLKADIQTAQQQAEQQPLEILDWDTVIETLDHTVESCLSQLRMWEEADRMLIRHGYRLTLEGNW
ncbi:hypothetical protein [Paenibacillus campi]|uniref:hypothetical protein n=1 Tax=Paenibacillus campi TaxID=3106031 RepID=UPI002B003649|nr:MULTISPECIES: hypothetical protein [unclassified Paenibacillus]